MSEGERLEDWRKHYNEAAKPQIAVGNVPTIMLAISTCQITSSDPTNAKESKPSLNTMVSSTQKMGS